ncbi:MAG: adenylosuccinate lyase, partial [Alphaproteobacteria bacterium]|nr:adenylosuccinate lyase [Alphaproteobacteria bacterium]
NVVGLARVVRSYAMPAFENVALWHERDMSHSSVERFIAPDATITLDFALIRMAGIIDKLLIRADRMQKNLDLTQGIVHSQRALLALTQAGIEREAAYKLVQGNAMRAWAGEGTLLELLKADPVVSKAVPAKALEAMFDNDYHFKHVDTVFQRVFGA